MQIVIPMSGIGARFVRAGYDMPKPLIEVDGAPMIEHVVRLFPGEQDFLFICARDHLEASPFSSVLERLAPHGRIVAIERHKKGPVHATLEAAEFIKDGEPIILSYCDFSVYWDYADFKRRMVELRCAGGITAYRGFHPHSLGPNLYAYMRTEDGSLLEIREKQCFTNDRMNEHASAGTYYFQSGALLKRYFREAVQQGLHTNGEYYASTPYNLMVADNLDVAVYELEHFLQWGTPQDLEEYQGWSTYFARYDTWRPRGPPMPGATVIPMAGSGLRFRREGYTEPKPLVRINGVPMVQRALHTNPPAERSLALCHTEHMQDPALESALCANGRDIRMLPISAPTDGQACTCLLAREWLDPAAPLLIVPCDATVVYDHDRYCELTSNEDVDCLVWTFRSHPHANRNPQQYGWVVATPEGCIEGISCKMPISEDVRRDPGIVGTFWFRQARFFLDAADALVARNQRINNEFYVDSAIEILIEQGRRAKVFDVTHYISFGTPNDVRTYEYWKAYFHKVRDRSSVQQASV